MRKRDEQLIALSCRLSRRGSSLSDQAALRRIEMTLHRWAEQECGNSNTYGAWAIERDEETGKVYMVHHHYLHGQGKDTVTRTRIADRERGAVKRLKAIMAAYPHLWSYHQGDPRGCALYVGRYLDLPSGTNLSKPEAVIDQHYTRGVAVCI